MGATASKKRNTPPQRQMSESSGASMRRLEAHRNQCERERQQDSFVASRIHFLEVAEIAATLNKNQDEDVIATRKKLLEEAANLATQKKLQKEAFDAAHKKLQEEAANLAEQKKLHKEALDAARMELQEEAAKLAKQVTLLNGSTKVKENAAQVAMQGKLQEEGCFAAHKRKLQEEAAKRAQQEEAAWRAQQEAATKRAHQEDAARRVQQEEAARRAQQEDAARRVQQEEAVWRAQQEAATKRARQEEATKRAQQEAVSKIARQQEAVRRSLQELAICRTQQEEAVTQAQQDEAANRDQQEKASKKAQQQEAVRRTQQEEEQQKVAVKELQQEEAARRAQQEKAIQKKQKKMAAKRARREEAARIAQEEAARLAQEEAAKGVQQGKPSGLAQEEAAKGVQQEEAARLVQDVAGRSQQVKVANLASEKQLESNFSVANFFAAQKKLQEEAARRVQQEAATKRALPDEAAQREQQEAATKRALQDEKSAANSAAVTKLKAFVAAQKEAAPKAEFKATATTKLDEKETPRTYNSHENPETLRWCASCYTRSTMKMYKCENGHGSCQHCKIMERECGICHSDLTDQRSYGSDKHVAQTRVPCPHACKGCVLSIRIADMEIHMKECPFKKQDCPLASTHFPKCEWIGETSELWSHFSKMHPNHLLTNVGSEMQIEATHGNCRRYVRLVELGYYFILHLKISEVQNKVLMAVQLIGTKISAKKWLYEIHVNNKNENRKQYMYTDNVRSSIDDIEEVFEKGECAVLPMRHAKTFFSNGKLTFRFFVTKIKEKENKDISSDRTLRGRTNDSEDENEDSNHRRSSTSPIADTNKQQPLSWRNSRFRPS